MGMNADDALPILARWPVLTVATIGITLFVAVMADMLNWNEMTVTEYDSYLVMPALLAPALVWMFGKRTGAETDIIRFAYMIATVTLVIVVLKLLGSATILGVTFFGMIQYSGLMIAICLLLLHAPLPMFEEQ
jgi:cell division protein FtsW (lipid II flippase)